MKIAGKAIPRFPHKAKPLYHRECVSTNVVDPRLHPSRTCTLEVIRRTLDGGFAVKRISMKKISNFVSIKFKFYRVCPVCGVK